MAKLSLFLVSAVLMVLIQGGAALKCWRCSSEEGTFCGETFDINSLPEQQRHFRYVECYLAQEPQQPFVSMKFRPVCKKTVQKINDRSIVNRTCSWEDMNSKDSFACKDEPTLSTVKTKFCQTCFTDGCNGAATQTISAVLFLGVITLIAKALNLFSD